MDIFSIDLIVQELKLTGDIVTVSGPMSSSFVQDCIANALELQQSYTYDLKFQSHRS